MALPAINHDQTARPSLTLVEGKGQRKPRTFVKKLFPLTNVSRTENGGYRLPSSACLTNKTLYLYKLEEPIPGWPDGTLLLVQLAEQGQLEGRLYLCADEVYESGRLGLGGGIARRAYTLDGLEIRPHINKTLFRIIGLVHREVKSSRTNTIEQFSPDGFELRDGSLVPAGPVEVPRIPTSDTHFAWQQEVAIKAFAEEWADRLHADYQPAFRYELPDGRFGLICPFHAIPGVCFGSVLIFEPIESYLDVGDGAVCAWFDATTESAVVGVGVDGGIIRALDLGNLVNPPADLTVKSHYFPYGDLKQYGRLVGIASSFPKDSQTLSSSGFRIGEGGVLEPISSGKVSK